MPSSEYMSCQQYPLVTTASRPGPMLAGCGLFSATIQRKGGHAASPHEEGWRDPTWGIQRAAFPVTMGAEDFSFFSQKMPAAIFVIGTKNETLKSYQPLHLPHFFLDEEALPIGVALNAAVAISYLDSHVTESQ
ncbi:hypothetical protein L1049_008282 [Liquidambar formosana]|uniref:Uncharacterized protein n=1 Tax=Liquidambar formosana TaxID=63359 RepID=A0AAP0S3B1_LIQFO